MLKHRVIPVLLYDGAFCVNTVQFVQPSRKIGPMEQYVNNMARRDVDELMILDINATRCVRGPLFAKLSLMTQDQYCPVSYGGGISSIDDIKRLINDCGVDKVVIKTHHELIEPAAHKFGSQAICYAMDCIKHHSDGSYYVQWIGREKGIRDWAQEIERRGAGEILLTHMHRQGTFTGYSENLIKLISSEVRIPVVANGGCGGPEDMVKAIKAGAYAVASSSMFALRGVTPQDCARALQAAGLPARVAQEPPE